MKMYSLFLGYGVPWDLDVKWCYAMTALDEATFERIEIQGDTMHLVPENRMDEAKQIIQEINEEYETDLILDFEKYQIIEEQVG